MAQENLDELAKAGATPEAIKAMMAGMFGERSGYKEIAEATNAREARHRTRMYTNLMELMWFAYEIEPNAYEISNILVPSLIHRIHELKVSAPLGLAKYSSKDVEAGLNTDAPMRKGLTDEYERNAREIVARKALATKLGEQKIFEGDVEEYMVSAFMRLGKHQMESRNYGVILNLSETHPGFQPYGEKVQEAINLWRKVALGQAAVEIVVNKGEERSETKTRRLPNLFALKKNRGLMDLYIKAFIAPNIGYQRGEVGEMDESQQDALRELEKLDNQAAAITAFLLIDHWDLNVEWGVGTNGYTQNFTAEDFANLDLELTGGDSGKGFWFELRRYREWRGNEPRSGRREHPRVAGSPATLDCYPRLATDALGIFGMEIIAERQSSHPDSQIIDAISKTTKVDKKKFTLGTQLSQLNLDQNKLDILLAELKSNKYSIGKVNIDQVQTVGDLLQLTKKRVITVSVKDAVWSGGKITRLEGDNEVIWTFESINLGQVPWDKTSVWDSEGDVAQILPSDKMVDRSTQLIDLAAGIPTGAFELPYKLQGFLAYKFLFAQIMRNDFLKQFDEVTQSDLLLKMNKGIDNALGLMSTAFNLDGDTVKALNNYIRVVFLGGLLASVVKSGAHGGKAGIKLERRAQVSRKWAKELGPAKADVVQAVNVSQFLPVIEEAGKDFKLTEPYNRLLDLIIENRKAPTPFELKAMGINLFSEKQLQKLRPLYPSSS